MAAELRQLDRRAKGDLIRMERTVRRSETRRRWVDIRRHAGHIHLAVTAERPDIALHAAGQIISIADARLRVMGEPPDVA